MPGIFASAPAATSGTASELMGSAGTTFAMPAASSTAASGAAGGGASGILGKLKPQDVGVDPNALLGNMMGGNKQAQPPPSPPPQETPKVSGGYESVAAQMMRRQRGY